MYFFYYQILNSKGTTKRGILQLPFDNDISVAVYLERRGDIVLYVKAFPIIINWLFAFLAWIFRQPISRQELAESLNNIAVMLKGGIPIIQTLQDILSEHTNKTIRKIGQDMVMRIESGSSFTVAAESHRRIFSDPVMFLFRIGEASGNLDRTILEASKHILNLDRIRKDAKQALIYPIFMFVAVLSALLFWITFVTPIMLEVYDDLKVDLPPLTTSIIATSDFIIRNMKTLIFSTVFTILGIFLLVKYHYKSKKTLHIILLKTPVIKSILSCFNIAFITEHLSLMVSSGSDVVSSIKVIEDTLPNLVFREQLNKIRNLIVGGKKLKDAFKQANLFPPFVTRMIGVGEETGALSSQLDYVSGEYRHRLNGLVATIGKTIEPIALFVGGAMFIILIIGLFMPLYDVIGSIGQ